MEEFFALAQMNDHGKHKERFAMMIRKRNPNRLEPLYDTIVGDGDDETLIGTDAGDLIQGLGGADSLVGLGGRDKIKGGEERDTLVGGRGSDTLVGGLGGDLFRFEAASDSRPGKADVITTFKGRDALDLSAIDADKGTAGNQDFVHVAALTGVAGQLAFSSDGGDGTIVEGDVDGDGIADLRIEIRFDGRDSLAGTDGDDTLIGYDEGETITGGFGKDVLLGGDGGDSLSGGFDEDTVDGGDGNDTIEGNGLADFITGGSGDDLLFSGSQFGNDRDDIVEGGAGNDTINVGGNCTADGGGGNDSILGGGPQIFLVVGELYGGAGDDTIVATENVFDVFGGVGDDYLVDGAYLHGGGGNDTLIGGGDSTALMFGDEGSDFLEGGRLDETLVGGLGADTLDGKEKRDVFVYESIEDSTAAAPDLIVKLTRNKSVDLSAIDANANVGGEQAFMRVPDFSGAAGELRLRYDSGLNRTFIEGDVDGDAVADFVIMTPGDRTDHTNFEL
ncbi:MAG: hypothetical protein H7X93_00475 [Sphingomonadaceae bacterium]|nr:hypothetical protein [Sphingomonadaceae bacterium]